MFAIMDVPVVYQCTIIISPLIATFWLIINDDGGCQKLNGIAISTKAKVHVVQ